MTARRLAAILAADVVGFSTLMERDEEGALARLKTLQHDVIEPRVADHLGRLVKTTGDGFLVEFPSPLEAVRCALKVQEAVSQNGALARPEEPLRLRIGINLGDIIIQDDGDIYGDGVNIATRLEQLAEPGSVCISGKVHGEVEGKVPAAFTFIGERQVKNIARPIKLYSSSSAPDSRAQAVEREPLAVPDRPSIAVLPFTNMSGDPEQEYFADGVVEDIITAISRIRWLFVIARNSSFTYKGKTVDVRQVGRELGVHYVLEGSIRKAGSRVRITGQLVETSGGRHIWADRFDGELADIFEFQDRITESVVGAIEPSLRKVQIERARSKPTDNLTAYDLYLRALPEFQSYSEEGFTRARTLLEQAIALDSGFSDAWTWLADCLGRMLISGWLEPVEDGRELVCNAALKATSLDPESGPALAMAAWALAIAGGQSEQAAEFADRALLLHPNSSYVRMQAGYGYLFNGQVEKALDCYEVARRLSPLDSRIYTIFTGIGAAHFFGRRFDEAVRWSRRAVEKRPNFAVALRFLAAALSHDGELEAAREVAAKLLQVQPNATLSWVKKRPYGLPWMTDLYVDGLRRAGVPE